MITLAPISHRPRPALLRATGPAVPCLLSARKDRGGRLWSLFGASLGPADGCFLSTRSSCRTRVFPACNDAGRENLDRARVEAWLGAAKPADERLDAAALIEYALGLLASEHYRRRFDGLLRRDYPRLLPPVDAEAWSAVRAVGRTLQRALHGLVDDREREQPSCGVGHFSPEALQQIAPATARARLALWREGVLAADRLVGEGACAWGTTR